MSNAAIQTEQWYKENADLLTKQFAKVGFRSDQTDPARGGVAIELEWSTFVASITVWNKGDISVLILKEGSQDPFALADRLLSPEENIPLLLNGYIRDILQQQ
jgi:hypothetical protein